MEARNLARATVKEIISPRNGYLLELSGSHEARKDSVLQRLLLLHSIPLHPPVKFKVVKSHTIQVLRVKSGTSVLRSLLPHLSSV